MGAGYVLMLLPETYFNIIDRYHLNVNGCNKMFQVNDPKMPAGIAILISNKIFNKIFFIFSKIIDFKPN